MTLPSWDTEAAARAGLDTALAVRVDDAARARIPEIAGARKAVWRIGCLASLFTGSMTLSGALFTLAGVLSGDPLMAIAGLALASFWPATLVIVQRIAKQIGRELTTGTPTVARITMAHPGAGTGAFIPPSIRYEYTHDGKELAATFTAHGLQLPKPRSYIRIAVDPADPRKSTPIFSDAAAGPGPAPVQPVDDDEPETR